MKQDSYDGNGRDFLGSGERQLAFRRSRVFPGLLLLLLCCLLGMGAANAAECLDNGDFENMAQGWQYPHWNGMPAPGQLVSDEVYGGRYAYCFHNVDYDKTNYLLRPFRYQPGESYRISLAMKGEGLAEQGVMLRVLCFGRDADGKEKVLSFASLPRGQHNLVQAGGSFPWQRFTVELLPEHFAAGTLRTHLYVYHAPNNQGRLWIDELSVQDSQAEPLRRAPSAMARQDMAAPSLAIPRAERGDSVNIWPGDASFETGSEHLRLPRDASIPAWHGDYSLRFGVGQTSIQSKYLFQLLRPGRSYRVSFYARSDRAGECVFTSWNQSYSMIIHQRFQVDTSWRRLSFAFPVSKTVTSPTMGFSKDGEQTLWIDAIQISEGEELPDFSTPQSLSVGFDELGDAASFLAPAAEAVQGMLRLRNNSPQRQELQLEAYLSDLDGQDRKLLTRTLSLSGESLHEEALELLPSRLRGYYVLRLRAKTPQELAAYDLPFVVMDEPLPPREDSFFGLHPGPESYTRRIGSSWSRNFRSWRWQKEVDGHYALMGLLQRGDNDLGMAKLECIGLNEAPPKYQLADSDPPGLPDPQEQMRFLREFVLAAKDSAALELINEPDLSSVNLYRKGRDYAVGRYCEQLEQMVPVIRELRPEVKVLAAGVSGVDFTRGFHFLEGVLARASEHIDVLAVHPYADARYICADGADIGPEHNGVYEKTLQLRDIVARYGGRQELWYGEIGWGLSVEEDYLSAASLRHGAYCARLMLLGMSAGVERVFYFLTDSCIERQRYYYGLWRSGRPLPVAAVYAATAQILEGAKSEQMVSNQDLHCFSYRHRDGRLFAALWTSLPDAFAAEIVLSPSSLSLRDMFNREQSCPAGETLRLRVSGQPQYLFCGDDLSAEDFHAALRTMHYDCPPMAFAWRLQRPDSLSVLVSNLRQQPLQGHCRLDGAEFTEPTRELSLAAGESVLLSFASPKSLHQQSLLMSAQTNLGEMSSSYRAEIMSCPRTEDGAQLLAASALPTEAGRLPSLSSRDYLLPNDPGNGWAGPEDLSMEGAVAYDDHYLYLLLDVRDDIHFQQQQAGRLWAEDAIQVGIDSLANALYQMHGYDQDDYEFGFALTPSGPTAELTHLYEVGRHEEVLAAVKTHIEREGDITRYRIAIPWTALKLEPHKGMIFAMNITANDNDGHGQRFWMGLTPGIVEGKNPYLFKKFALE